ncbi:MAG: T9SS type A sorting domain-containing protein, partial [Bacteroidales bacterium]|nr:T9SS type A sorting domain-containing protein [Bacteroidales bacterium]
NQGLAFDNFFVGERVKNSVLEHFTNSASSEAIAADGVVEQFVSDHFNLVIDLQYHMDYPGEDPMNLNNPVPPSARSFNYGVPSVPYAVLNGEAGPEYRYDFSDLSEQPNGDVLMTSSLDIPPFDVNLTTDFLANSLKGKVKVTCKEDDFDSNIQLYVVVIEQLVTAYTGAGQTTSFRNVVLDILPSASGKLLGNEWGAGISKVLDFSWDYASYVEDVDDLMVVAFIFDRDHDQILQAAMLEYSPGVGFEKRPAAKEILAIYPNPAHEYVYINFGAEVEQLGQLKVVDLAGRSVMTSDVLSGFSIQMLDISSLSQGIYLVQWLESGVLKGRGKLVHVR